jgi:hypothetical protein
MLNAICGVFSGFIYTKTSPSENIEVMSIIDRKKEYIFIDIYLTKKKIYDMMEVDTSE